MQKEKTKYLFLIIGSIMLLILGFISLSDISKAKVSLQLLGVHESNQSKFSSIPELILANNYDKSSTLLEIRAKDKLLLENYLNVKELSDFYAFNGQNWNSSCQPQSEIPNQKFEYLYFSDNSLIVCSLSGGLGSSYFYDFYEIHAGKLELVGTVNILSPRILDLAVSLRYDEDLINWAL